VNALCAIESTCFVLVNDQRFEFKLFLVSTFEWEKAYYELRKDLMKAI
jgi:hypothetical protein